MIYPTAWCFGSLAKLVYIYIYVYYITIGYLFGFKFKVDYDNPRYIMWVGQ